VLAQQYSVRSALTRSEKCEHEGSVDDSGGSRTVEQLVDRNAFPLRVELGLTDWTPFDQWRACRSGRGPLAVSAGRPCRPRRRGGRRCRRETGRQRGTTPTRLPAWFACGSLELGPRDDGRPPSRLRMGRAADLPRPAGLLRSGYSTVVRSWVQFA